MLFLDLIKLSNSLVLELLDDLVAVKFRGLFHLCNVRAWFGFLAWPFILNPYDMMKLRHTVSTHPTLGIAAVRTWK